MSSTSTGTLKRVDGISSILHSCLYLATKNVNSQPLSILVLPDPRGVHSCITLFQNLVLTALICIDKLLKDHDQVVNPIIEAYEVAALSSQMILSQAIDFAFQQLPVVDCAYETNLFNTALDCILATEIALHRTHHSEMFERLCRGVLVQKCGKKWLATLFLTCCGIGSSVEFVLHAVDLHHLFGDLLVAAPFVFSAQKNAGLRSNNRDDNESNDDLLIKWLILRYTCDGTAVTGTPLRTPLRDAIVLRLYLLPSELAIASPEEQSLLRGVSLADLYLLAYVQCSYYCMFVWSVRI